MFASSQEKIFGQIEERFYQFYMDLAEITKAVADDETVQAYLTDTGSDPVEAQRITYEMQQQVEKTKILEYDNMTLLFIGMNGRSYMYSYGDLISLPFAAIYEFPVTKEAGANPGQLICKYMEHGFTDTMKNEPVVAVCRAIQNKDGYVIGYVYLVLKETEIRGFYDYFISGTSDIVVFNQKKEVISTNNERYLSNGSDALRNLQDIAAEAKESHIYQTVREEDGECIMYLIQQFTNTDFVIAGTVNAERTFYEKYNLVRNIVLAVVIAAVNILFVFILVSRQTRPIYRLAKSMREQKQRDFGEYVKVEGTDEIRELSQTYNEMITDLHRYIDKVVETEQAKRTVELHALQMQINPHYIYNTLASIKWLIMQGCASDSAAAIDAFIALLRNTISNADEFITVRQEGENLRNYVKINQIRYGGRVNVEFYIQETCMDAKIPKMSLQPFIENAFFHAFPNGRRGNINVFVQQRGGRLSVEIADDGVGMTKQRLDSMRSKEQKQEHFTGIGVHNVDERLKLIYGMEYGVRIESERDCGTSVVVEIPFALV